MILFVTFNINININIFAPQHVALAAAHASPRPQTPSTIQYIQSTTFDPEHTSLEEEDAGAPGAARHTGHREQQTHTQATNTTDG